MHLEGNAWGEDQCGGTYRIWGMLGNSPLSKRFLSIALVVGVGTVTETTI